MIEVKVKPYCENCKNFDPDMETLSGYFGGTGAFVKHIIKCSHRDQCASMETHIRNEIEKGESSC